MNALRMTLCSLLLLIATAPLMAQGTYTQIDVELCYCAENRAANGLADNFWERMFQLYRRGVWACGWRGFFPRPGKFVAYRRAEPSR